MVSNAAVEPNFVNPYQPPSPGVGYVMDLGSPPNAMNLADVGTQATSIIVDRVRQAFRDKEITGEVEAFVRQQLRDQLAAETPGIQWAASGPTVVMVAGVNGSGKTTSIAKLAKRLQGDGKKVLVAACDTFRAAAVEQLTVWAGRIGCEIVKQGQGADPSAVAPDRSIFRGKRYLPIRLLEFARGCRYRCEFCAVQSFHQATQTHRDVDRVMHAWITGSGEEPPRDRLRVLGARHAGRHANGNGDHDAESAAPGMGEEQAGSRSVEHVEIAALDLLGEAPLRVAATVQVDARREEQRRESRNHVGMVGKELLADL